MTNSVNTKRVILQDVSGNYLIPYTDGSAIGSFSYDELTDKPSINSVTLSGNKTSADLGLMSNENFIPAGTTINVKLDGTGDFTNLQSAINFLDNKYSNGVVNIQLGSGTFNITSPISLNVTKSNLGRLEIYGQGVNDTIIKCTSGVTDQFFTIQGMGGYMVRLYNFTVDGNNQCNHGITAQLGSHVLVDTTKSTKMAISCYYIRRGAHMISKNIVALTGKIGISCDNSDFVADVGSTLTITSCTTGLNVSGGGVIRGRYVTKAFSSVTNENSQTAGTFNSNGFIGITYR